MSFPSLAGFSWHSSSFLESYYLDSMIILYNSMYIPSGVLPSLALVIMRVTADDIIVVTMTDTSRVITHAIATASPMDKESGFK